MLRLTPEQRALLADKVPDFVNLVSGGFVLGQLIGDQPFSALQVGTGLLLWAVLMWFMLVAARERR